MVVPMNKPEPRTAGEELRKKVQDTYDREIAERVRKTGIMLARMEPMEDEYNISDYRVRASIAISLKRIADAMEAYLKRTKA